MSASAAVRVLPPRVRSASPRASTALVGAAPATTIVSCVQPAGTSSTMPPSPDPRAISVSSQKLRFAVMKLESGETATALVALKSTTGPLSWLKRPASMPAAVQTPVRPVDMPPLHVTKPVDASLSACAGAPKTGKAVERPPASPPVMPESPLGKDCAKMTALRPA
jgi:hypothetical protein